ncbi:hypothetical protein AVEN_13799-1 [Araneus ventricosus]|uniref:EGF-like domain-containing protein n=1 Tax=Araneus ventricosus TaxID=182803 RepID=A0A4Y2HXG9_ARAVE|nr:hypothetical protein AVEN_13799-1 [Araneus ventricosus]
MNIFPISFVLSACNCGPDSNCTFSGLFQQKKCICKPGYWVVNGKCVGPCDEQPCQNGGTCNVGEIGFICNCVAPFSGPRCENGPCTSNPCQNNGTCEVSEYSYRCNCNKPFKGTNCEIECDCGPYGMCGLESGRKRCFCDSNYAEKNGKCEYCSCGENSKSCRYNLLGEKECNCSSAYAQNRGYCEDCNCGPYGSCSFEYDRKRCNCKSFAVEMNGVCVVMESTTLEGSTSAMTTALPLTTQCKF